MPVTSLLADTERLLARNLIEMGWPPAQAASRAAIVTIASQGVARLARGGGGIGGFRRILGRVRTFLGELPAGLLTILGPAIVALP